MAAITSTFYRCSVIWLVGGLLAWALLTVPAVLGAPTEIDQLRPVLDAYLQPGDGLLAGCCADEPLRYLYPAQYARVNASRWFIVPSSFPLDVDIVGCQPIGRVVYLCTRLTAMLR